MFAGWRLWLRSWSTPGLCRAMGRRALCRLRDRSAGGPDSFWPFWPYGLRRSARGQTSRISRTISWDRDQRDGQHPRDAIECRALTGLVMQGLVLVWTSAGPAASVGTPLALGLAVLTPVLAGPIALWWYVAAASQGWLELPAPGAARCIRSDGLLAGLPQIERAGLARAGVSSGCDGKQPCRKRTRPRHAPLQAPGKDSTLTS